jgi:hypothetical protein
MKRTLFDPAQLESLRSRFGKLTPQSPAAWGKMNAHQMITHCADALQYTLGERPAKMRQTFLLRTLVKWLVVNNILPAPKGKVVTFPEIAQDKAGTQPKEFEEDRKRLFQLLDRHVQMGPNGTYPDHPMFGRMTGKQWAKLTAAHFDHHLRQFSV